ncbi:MAG: hypothetical protein LZF61_02215 [Nitrosomonas sp.]|nr:MAG: hypothetical protein LZF61_02215 [Nitrosomonas sp.]
MAQATAQFERNETARIYARHPSVSHRTEKILYATLVQRLGNADSFGKRDEAQDARNTATD